jgi:hypothetical protein
MRHFLEVLKSMKDAMKEKRDRRHLYMVSRAMTATLSGMALCQFFSEALKGKVMSEDYLHAAIQFRYYALDPYVILDYMAHLNMNKTLNEIVVNLPESQIGEVLDFAIAMIDLPDQEKIQKLRELSCFAQDYLEGRDMNQIWTTERVKEFVENVCSLLNIAMPQELKFLRLHKFLDCNLEYFSRGNWKK